MTKYIAVCPKCEKIYSLTHRQTEAWCQHISVETKFVDGPEEVKKVKKLPKHMGDVEKFKCKIVEVET